MGKRYPESGFTLVEIIVAIAILTIILVPFSLLFTESFVAIFSAGNKNEALYTVQKKIENEIGNPLTQGEVHTLEIIFPTVTRPVRVDGTIVTINEPYYRRDYKETVELKVFVP